MSRQELAEQVGVHYQTIGYIERGEYSPSLVLALRFASVLSAKVEEIFWLDEDQE
jgi:DNA-binding XRE family transcriptional regulator